MLGKLVVNLGGPIYAVRDIPHPTKKIISVRPNVSPGRRVSEIYGRLSRPIEDSRASTLVLLSLESFGNKAVGTSHEVLLLCKDKMCVH